MRISCKIMQKVCTFAEMKPAFLIAAPTSTRISDSSPHQRLWQDNDCQRTDGTSYIEGHEGATFQVRPRLYRYQVS